MCTEDARKYVEAGLHQRKLDREERAREAELETEGKRRAQLIRSLGFACGAAVFLILV